MYRALPADIFGNTKVLQRTVKRSYIILQNRYHEVSENNAENILFVPCINSIDTILLLQTDAHNYKIIGKLKQNSDYRSDMFRFTQEPSSGSCLVLS